MAKKIIRLMSFFIFSMWWVTPLSAKEQSINQNMKDIFHELTFLYPLALNPGGFRGKADAKTSLYRLYQSTNSIHHFDHSKNLGAKYLLSSTKADAKAAWQRFEDQRYEESQFIIRHITENCVACHSLLPSEKAFPLVPRFVQFVNKHDALPSAKARLFMASRQNDKALAIIEEDIQSKSLKHLLFKPEIMTLYFSLLLSAPQQYDRGMACLELKLKSSSHAEESVATAKNWIDSLRDLKSMPAENNLVVLAERHIASSKKLGRFPSDLNGLVYKIAALKTLERAMEVITVPSTLSRIYLLAGEMELQIFQSFWLSKPQNYLETAIHLHPKGINAKKAYDALEQHLVLGYTGTSGVHLPDEVKDRLAGYRKMIGIENSFKK